MWTYRQIPAFWRIITISIFRAEDSAQKTNIDMSRLAVGTIQLPLQLIFGASPPTAELTCTSWHKA
jgi:hypothetical protein